MATETKQDKTETLKEKEEKGKEEEEEEEGRPIFKDLPLCIVQIGRYLKEKYKQQKEIIVCVNFSDCTEFSHHDESTTKNGGSYVNEHYMVDKFFIRAMDVKGGQIAAVQGLVEFLGGVSSKPLLLFCNLKDRKVDLL